MGTRRDEQSGAAGRGIQLAGVDYECGENDPGVTLGCGAAERIRRDGKHNAAALNSLPAVKRDSGRIEGGNR